MDALLDAGVQRGALEHQSDLHGGARTRVVGQERGEGLAGDLDDLERTHDPPRVARGDRPSRRGVEVRQALVQPCRAHLVRLSLQASPDSRVGAREAQVVRDGADVEPGSAHEHGLPPARVDARDGGTRSPLELHDGRGLAHVEHVDEVVRDAAALRDGKLRRADVHAPVQLKSIPVHDLTVPGLRQRDAEVRFARRGRPHDGHERSRHGRSRPSARASRRMTR